MKRISLVHEAHKALQTILQAGDYAIDATVGNGHDTLFLARHVGPEGIVLGFDIQQSAIDKTRRRLEQGKIDTPVELFRANHAEMTNMIPAQFHGRIKAVMFNLGYLPGGDKLLITRTDTTIAALNQALRMLAPDGLLTILAYPGHPGGDQEADEVDKWCADLEGSRYDKSCINSQENQKSTPRLYLIKPA
ncbi:class I SAM-dependent methyltransferase [Methylotuvimicrobium buryatense]|uniref:Methyltransferase domain-containing protein n=1 Tax=Methylotuvimicrobium buryatense TaxID=95641 RepID=A0A4P9US67_METBY|nr:class I SAM-dependent methyltransferase [Methylotuvimicrobium buryatense]QCW82556.1 methyltransferase domain-containing protein [Methylotuvimicrobium buryatense]